MGLLKIICVFLFIIRVAALSGAHSSSMLSVAGEQISRLVEADGMIAAAEWGHFFTQPSYFIINMFKNIL